MLDMTAVFIPSENIVARQIDDEFLLVPIASGIGDLENCLYTLNATGKCIWQKMACGKSLNQLVDELAAEFDAPREHIAEDVCGVLDELIRLSMVLRCD